MESAPRRPVPGRHQLDGTGGVEVLLGRIQGANLVGYHVLTLRRGRLAALAAPAGGMWFNKGGTSSGTFAYTCTRIGVNLTSAFGTLHHGIRVTVKRYRRASDRWVLAAKSTFRATTWKHAGDLDPWHHCPTTATASST